jgi:CBS domain-containing protein
MTKDGKISEIMTRTVYAVRERDELSSVISLIKKHKIRHVPVTKNGRISGIISSSDVNRLTFGAMFENQYEADEAILQMLSIPQVMTHKPMTINQDATISDVARIFAQKEYHALPVVDDDGRLQGIVTTTDVIRYMLAD